MVGPWGWVIVVYVYVEREDRVAVVAFQDARSADSLSGPGGS